MLFGICIGPCLKVAKQSLKEMESLVDGVEIRLDTFKDLKINEIKQLISFWKKPFILTFGVIFFQINVIHYLIELSPSYIDVPYDISDAALDDVRKTGVKIIGSYHNYQDSSDIEFVFDRLKQRSFDVIKIASYAQSSLDGFKMLLLLTKAKEEGVPFIGISMGDLGAFTRVLSPIFSGYITFASYQSMQSAPGQISIETLLTLYRFRSLSPSTKVFALIGEDTSLSLSPHIHNTVFLKKNIDAVYVPISLKVNELSSFFTFFRRIPSFIGLSVTIPFKESSLSFVDNLTPSAREILAVNTIWKRKGSLFGDNTDWLGALRSVEDHISLKGKKALIVGSGGAARAICYALKSKNLDVYVKARSKAHVDGLIREFGVIAYCKCSLSPFDLIINTTPMPLEDLDSLMHTSSLVMDINYGRAKTKYLKTIESQKIKAIDGLFMLLYQAIEQQGLWRPLFA